MNKNKIKEFLWPIQKKELILVLPMALMMFCFLFNYTIMRDLKDTLILNACGAEAIPFIKFWGTLPAALLFVILYAKLSNIVSQKTLYIVTILPFFIFFVAFGFILYPLRDSIHPTETAEHLRIWLLNKLPLSMHPICTALTLVIKNWTYAAFYVMSELWGSMGVSLLFWQFANSITSTEEAKRFYPRFTQLGNLALLVSGYTILHFSKLYEKLPAQVDAWGITLRWLMFFVGINCVLLLTIYYFIQNWKEKNKRTTQKTKNEKPKLSLKESFLFLIKSKYLGLITLLVLCYGLSTNLIEVVYKNQLKLLFPTNSEMGVFYGKLSMSIGATTFIMVLCSGFVLNKISWRAAAIATPLFMLFTGGLFFSTLMFKREYETLFSFSPLVIGVVFGSIQYSLSKGIKYALFDPSKEMTYIPLDPESKVKGKAAIDVIGGRMGKSLGGIYLQFILLFGAISENIGLLFISVIVVVLIWSASIFKLSPLYHKKTQHLYKGEKKLCSKLHS